MALWYLICGNDQKAVNIVISGRYRDHQNHSWDVDYTIYLGEDNYGDFNIKRNSEYNKRIAQIEQLEAEGKITVLRPVRPIEVDRIERDTKKLLALYNEGYACAEALEIVK